MKSIKPGRGPSAMNAAGSVIAIIFGIFWTASAASMGAPGFFPLFGVLFIIMGIIQAAYHFKNTTSENRFSEFEITDEGEEKDPLNEKFLKKVSPQKSSVNLENIKFCPFCGTSVDKTYEFCPKCGKQLP